MQKLLSVKSNLRCPSYCLYESTSLWPLRHWRWKGIRISKDLFMEMYVRSSDFHHVHYPLSTLISSLSMNHHLYADNSQVFSHFTHPTSTRALPICNMPFSKSLPGWLPVSWLSIPPRLNSYSLDSKSNLTRHNSLARVKIHGLSLVNEVLMWSL